MGLIDKIKPTKKVGEGQVLTAFYLQFPDIEGTPTYELEDSLTVGSEAGEVILASEGISPRHCTFYLNQDVISVMDHGSHEGTYIGKKSLDPGRMIILLPNDKIKLGDLKVKVISEVKNVAVEPEFKAIDADEFHTEGETEASDLHDLVDDIVYVEEEVEEEESSPKISLKVPKLGKNVFKVKVSSGQVSNGFLRTLAVIFDFLIAAIILTLVSPLADAMSVINEILPTMIGGLNMLLDFIKETAAFDLGSKVSQLIKGIPVAQSLWEDVLAFYKNPAHQSFWQTLSLFIVLRLSTTFVFGVSLGQFLAGIRADGNAIVARIMGVVRECFGFITGPFLVFDSLTLLNRPSLKEMMTFTRVMTPSGVKAWVFSILSLAILLALYITSPFFKGLVPLEPYKYMDALKPVTSSESTERAYFSKKFGLSFNEDIKNNLIPTYTIVKVGAKKIAHVEISLLTENDNITIRPYREFSWSDLLKTALNLNPMAHEKFSSLYSTIHAPSTSNKMLNLKSSGYNDFASAVVALTNTAFNMGIENVTTYAQEFGPFMRTFVDYRHEFLGMMPAQAKLQMVTNSIDSAVFVSSSLNGKYYIIPITFPAGMVFEVSSKSMQPDQLQNYLKKFYFLNPELSKSQMANAKFNLMSFIDTIYDGLAGAEKPEAIQNSYEWLYMRLQQLMKNPNDKEVLQWTRSIKKLMQLLETVGLDQKMQMPSWSKFYQHLNELLKALEDRDLEFFGVSRRKMA